MVIEDCYISVGDDGIAIKSGWDQYGIAYGRPSTNILIRNLVVRSMVRCVNPYQKTTPQVYCSSFLMLVNETAMNVNANTSSCTCQNHVKQFSFTFSSIFATPKPCRIYLWLITWDLFFLTHGYVVLANLVAITCLPF